jgi:hypothetical protein
MKSSIELTSDETMCVLAAVVQGIANFTSAKGLDREDRESLMQLRSAALKLAQAVGMTIEELHAFAAYAAGKPAESVVKVIEEEMARAGSGP